MNRTPVRLATVSLLTVAALACGNPTGPTSGDLLAQRALWSRQDLKNYSYDYTETGFFICCTEGRQLKLEVRSDTVVSAVFDATGQPVPGSPARLPTIDVLFDLAERAARDHRLGGILFDAGLHYPVRIDLTGPPDASGVEFAAHVTPLP
jgi:hypothetical protein